MTITPNKPMIIEPTKTLAPSGSPVALPWESVVWTMVGCQDHNTIQATRAMIINHKMRVNRLRLRLDDTVSDEVSDNENCSLDDMMVIIVSYFYK